ncbi:MULTISPECIES: site-specific integrase [Pseudomonas]|uniref:site-specific integrase n=1 Tax=Pseudomonas TaxID=286 RepID=UPI000F618C8A|nr:MULTISPECIES: tyrosine-type recombinase/integrase [Pseudomonas]MBB1612300.1 integrase [Pseudomonas sp. UMC65]MBB1622548.1 integrase [Pseudomonas sp. UME65]MBP5105726.1 tyrosine-type recombinase/integrase [Pseudomonas protegens]MBP5122785.1 tyrosine-type recombinase/integrase [Pseudomonas protegens]MBP5131741.1 tyrosine-type recombinase/integrase [Pseudomonas protegens]
MNPPGHDRAAGLDAPNPLSLYLKRLAPSSQSTLRYVLQDAADRLGYAEQNLEEIPWHLLQPEHVTALVATLREDGYAPNTSSLYVNALRGVMNEAWRASLISQDHLLKMRSVKAISGTRLARGRNLKRGLIHELMAVCASDPRPQGVRDAALIALLYGSGMRKSESVNLDLAQVDFSERSLQVLAKGNRQLIKYAPTWAFDKLQAWLELRRRHLPAGLVDDPFLFNRIRRGGHITRERITKHAIYYIARQRGAEVGVRIMPHDFRRSFITRVIEEHDLSLAQKLAHHSNIQTTASYDLRDDNERRRAIDRFDL